jgi:hypothetical protein
MHFCHSRVGWCGAANRAATGLQGSVDIWLVPTEPAVEAPARKSEHALARLNNMPIYELVQDSETYFSFKQGGHTRSYTSPSCPLCCNWMDLMLSLSCDGMVVAQSRSSAIVVEVFKCPLHAHEMRCLHLP